MTKYLYRIIAALMLLMSAGCVDSNLEGWEPYLPTGQALTVNIGLDKYQLQVEAQAVTETISVTSDGNWTVTSDAPWCTTSVTEGNRNQVLQLNIAENTTAKTRECNLAFTTSSGNKVQLKVSQNGKSLTVDPQVITLQKEGGSAEITVTTNSTYIYKKHADWLTVVPSYTGYTLTAQENLEPGQRMDTLTISLNGLTEGEVHVDVIITQFGTDYSMSVSPQRIPEQGEATADEGSYAVELSTSDAWTATSTATWITLSVEKGEGPAMITANLRENSTTESRSGKIRFEGVRSGLMTEVNIAQEGKYLKVGTESLLFGNDGGEAKIEVTTNGTIEAVTNDSWLTATTDGKNVMINATPNAAIESRHGLVTISLLGLTSGSRSVNVSVTQSAMNYHLSIDPSSCHTESAPSIQSFTLDTNDEWNAQISDEKMLKLSANSGTGSMQLTLNIAENNTEFERTASLTITGHNSGLKATYSIKQDGKYLKLNPSSVHFDAEGGTSNVEVETDGQYTVSITDEWITCENTGKTIKIRAAQNPNPGPREGYIKVSLQGLEAGNKLEKEITVTQNGKSSHFDVTPSELRNVPAEGLTTDLTIASNVDWSVAASDTWISLSTTTGLNDGIVRVTIADNAIPESRTGNIIFSSANFGTRSVIVEQFGAAFKLEVSPTMISETSTAASKTVTVTSNDEWTVTKTESWITLSATNGSGDGTFKVLLSENTSTSSRNGSVTVTGKISGISQTISVSQAGKENTEDSGSQNIDLEGYGQDKNLDGTGDNNPDENNSQNIDLEGYGQDKDLD